MAFTVTSRSNTTKTEAAGNGVTTLDSSSFTPAAGSLLAVFASGEANDSAYPTTFAVSDRDSSWGITGPDGTGSWQTFTATWTEATTWTNRVTLALGKVGTSASGVVRLTRSPGTSWTNSMYLQVAEITGQATQNITNTGSNTNVTGSTITLTLASSPATDSLVVGHIIDTGTDGTITEPSGWTELGETAPGGIFVHQEAAYKIGSSVQGPQWSSLAGDGTAGGIVAEITIDSGAPVGTNIILPRLFVTRR